jgi:hypothetical protein
MNNPGKDVTEHEPARHRESEKASGRAPEIEPSSEDEPSNGPNLVLLYSFLALALAVAIGIAVSIVLPFYHRR